MSNKEMTNYKGVPCYEWDDKEEIWKYTTLFTDAGNFEILMSLEDLILELQRVKNETIDNLFKYKKLEEYSKVMEHYWELVLDLSEVKILWYKEHIIVDNLEERSKISEKDNLEV